MSRRNTRVGAVVKYKDCNHVVRGKRWYFGRELTAKEIDMFRLHVAEEIDARVSRNPRLKRVKFEEHTADVRSEVANSGQTFQRRALSRWQS